MKRTKKPLAPIHPGEILCEDYLKPIGFSMNRTALDLRVSVTRIAEIVHERRGVTSGTALRRARCFNSSARFWMNLHAAFDLEEAEDEFSEQIREEVRPAGKGQLSLT